MTTLASPAAPARTPTRSRFGRVAGIAGLVAVAAGVGQMLVLGELPGAGESATSVADWFASAGGAMRLSVVTAALIGIPIALFMAGVHRTLAEADREAESNWATVFLYGAVMMSATAGMGELLRAFLALRGAEGVDPVVVQLLNDGRLVAEATLGVWIATALGAVAVATFRNGVRRRWYGWYCAAAAVLGVLAVVDTVSTGTGGAFSTLSFVTGVIVWMPMTSILLLRDHR